MQNIISASNFADIMGVSKATLRKWEVNGTFVPFVGKDGNKYFEVEKLLGVPEISGMVHSAWEEEMETRPLRPYSSVELFAGAGGLALGMEKAGFSHVLLNEIDADACATLRGNRPEWRVVEQDVREISFGQLRGKVDFLSGGFPCQAFSYAGKQGGFNDTRGTLFFELARAVKEIQPKVFMGENVKGLSAHDGGRTLETIKNTIRELGYTPGLQPAADYIAIKMPVFSFEKIRGAEISLGPEMKSTGECLGIAKTFNEALYKAFEGAGVRLPKYKNMIMTIRHSEQEEAVEVARRFEAVGYKIFATKGTARTLKAHGVKALEIRKLEQESPNILDLVLGHQIDLIIDIPAQGAEHGKDGLVIRRNAIETGVHVLTSLDTANALATSLENRAKELTLIDIAKVKNV